MSNQGMRECIRKKLTSESRSDGWDRSKLANKVVAILLEDPSRGVMVQDYVRSRKPDVDLTSIPFKDASQYRRFIMEYLSTEELYDLYQYLSK